MFVFPHTVVRVVQGSPKCSGDMCELQSSGFGGVDKLTRFCVSVTGNLGQAGFFMHR